MEIKKLAIWVPKPYSSDELFNEDSYLNRDSCLAAFHALRNMVSAKGGRCNTLDVYQRENIVPDCVLFLDTPISPLEQLLGNWYSIVERWLFIQECEVIHPGNWNSAGHKEFKKIFTWNDDIVDNKKYIKLNFSNLFPVKINKELYKKDYFCTTIAGNKHANHPLELYSKRIEAIQWFEKNHPAEYEFYGFGWEKKDYPSYKGIVESKRMILEKYKFSICYENARDIPGYITEKIFDCFFAGCIPIYWGANNVTDHIPSQCFIDRRNFSSYEDLYLYIKGLSDDEYMGYVNSIQEYLHSKQSYQFTTEYFAETIIREMNLGKHMI